MSNILESLPFSVRLSFTAHERANEKRRHQADPQKAQQVYFDALGEYAVEFYLKRFLLGDLKALSNMYFAVFSSDLESVHIPAEVRARQEAVVAVSFNESLTEATLYGFADRVEAEELSLQELRAIDELPEYLLCSQESPEEMDQDESLPEQLRRLIAQMLKAGWRKMENWADDLLPQRALPESAAYAASSTAEADLAFCKTIYLEESKQEVEICTEWTDVSDLEPEFDISVLIRIAQDNSVSRSETDSDVAMSKVDNQSLPVGLKASITFPNGKVHDCIEVNTQTEQVRLKKLSVFGNTQFNIKISDSDFIFVESAHVPENLSHS